MGQQLLPLIPAGAQEISGGLSVYNRDGDWTYFSSGQPVFSHAEEDVVSFRMFSSQLVCQGACRQMDIVRVFGVSKNSVKRSVKKYRQEGIRGFYTQRKGRGASVITAEVKQQAEELLSSGVSRSEVAELLEVKADTLRKAIASGRVHEPAQVQKKTAQA